MNCLFVSLFACVSFTCFIPVDFLLAQPTRQVKVRLETTWESYDHRVALPQTCVPTASRGYSTTAWVRLYCGTALKLYWTQELSTRLMASSHTREALMSRRVTVGAPGLLLLLSLFTCLLRCALCAKASNVILILTDDLDVELGGMVSFCIYFHDISFSFLKNMHFQKFHLFWHLSKVLIYARTSIVSGYTGQSWDALWWLTDAHGERRLARVIRSNKSCSVM